MREGTADDQRKKKEVPKLNKSRGFCLRGMPLREDIRK
jgi:hypothetical protein